MHDFTTPIATEFDAAGMLDANAGIGRFTMSPLAAVKLPINFIRTPAALPTPDIPPASNKM